MDFYLVVGVFYLLLISIYVYKNPEHEDVVKITSIIDDIRNSTHDSLIPGVAALVALVLIFCAAVAVVGWPYFMYHNIKRKIM